MAHNTSHRGSRPRGPGGEGFGYDPAGPKLPTTTTDTGDTSGVDFFAIKGLEDREGSTASNTYEIDLFPSGILPEDSDFLKFPSPSANRSLPFPDDPERIEPESELRSGTYQGLPPSSLTSLNPLPSLPSVSNLGAAPFTGIVNWNAVPGGFQPLPLTAGRRKKLYQLSQFHGGLNKKSSPRDIADFECQEALNVTFSGIGRIGLLGDCQNENKDLKLFVHYIQN